MACPEIAARTRREWGEIFAVGDPEHRHVRRRIAPRQRRPDAPPIRNRDRDVLIGFQGFLGNDPTVDYITIVQSTEIRNVTPADVDPKLVVTPDAGSPDALD